MSTSVILIHPQISSNDIKICDIPEGTYFLGRMSGETETQLYVRSFSHVMQVLNPHNTWTVGAGRVWHYQPIKKMEIKIIE